MSVRGSTRDDDQPGRLQSVVDGDPEMPGGLQGDGVDAARLEPRGHGRQVAGEGSKGADRLRVAIRRHSDEMRLAADIDGGCVKVGLARGQGRRGGVFVLARSSGHGGLRAVRG